jgi:FG-GAP repeat
MAMRRAIGILLPTTLVLLLVWPVSALVGAQEPTTTVADRIAVRADFNGDDQADLAIGAPRENDV